MVADSGSSRPVPVAAGRLERSSTQRRGGRARHQSSRDGDGPPQAVDFALCALARTFEAIAGRGDRRQGTCFRVLPAIRWLSPKKDL
jgi:hypothetical protein